MKEEILHQLSAYAAGTRDLQYVEEWVVSTLQSVLDSGDESAIELINELDTILMEIGNGEKDEIDLMKYAVAMLQNNETMRLNFCQDCEEQNFVETASESQSISAQADLTGLDRVIRLHHVFG